MQEIINNFLNYIQQHDGSWFDWYIGIAENPQERLFTDHNVQEQGGVWIFDQTTSSDQSRAIEKYFLDKGCDGGSGGGSSTSRYVYAYKKTWDTKENN